MKINFLLTTIIAATLASCSTSYKTGQTPDDVYYSPVRLQNNEVRREDDNKREYDNSTVYDSPGYTPYEEREIRRRINNRRYRRYHDRYNRYDYPYGYNNYPPVYGNPKTGTTTKTQQPRTTNLGGYTNTPKPDSTNYNPKLGRINTGSTAPVRTFGTPKTSSSNSGSGVGNAIRRIFSGDNNSNNSSSNNSYNNSNSNNSSPTRTFENRSSSNNTPSSSNSSSTNSSSSSSGSSAPVRTFKKD